MLELHGVTKTFGAVRALDGVDLVVPTGGIFGLVGPNGAGKTTLFSLVCGFLAADAGTVAVAGVPVHAGRPPAPGTMAILPQDARFLPHATVGAQLAYYAELQGFDRAAARREAARVLELVRLPDVAGRAADTLSHGMYKRVGIAQTFIGDPRLIILDEPTAGLDPHAAREIRGMLRAICADRSVVVSSHNLLEIEDLCREVAILHRGRVARQGRIEDLKGDASEVSFRMSERPADAVLAALGGFPYVTGVQWDAEASRVRVAIDPSQKAPAAAGGELVGALVGQGVRFLDMSVGSSLEDRFLEETRR
jgi:ABC-type multidrug transport system ATPase subunit